MVEWVLIEENIAVVADKGRAWLHKIDEQTQRPWINQMTGPGSLETTGPLLNAVVAFGISTSGPETYTRDRYVVDLISAYHNTHKTVPNFKRAAETLRQAGRDNLAEYLLHHGVEETGHDGFVIKDLTAMGLPADLVEKMPSGILPVLEIFDQLAEASYPKAIGMIGYSFAFESTANMKGEKEVAEIKKLLPEGIDCTRFLRTHSALGSEASHVTDLIEFIASLPAIDRIVIALWAYETAKALGAYRSAVAAMSDSDITEFLQAA